MNFRDLKDSDDDLLNGPSILSDKLISRERSCSLSSHRSLYRRLILLVMQHDMQFKGEAVEQIFCL